MRRREGFCRLSEGGMSVRRAGAAVAVCAGWPGQAGQLTAKAHKVTALRSKFVSSCGHQAVSDASRDALINVLGVPGLFFIHLGHIASMWTQGVIVEASWTRR